MRYDSEDFRFQVVALVCAGEIYFEDHDGVQLGFIQHLTPVESLLWLAECYRLESATARCNLTRTLVVHCN